MTNRIISFEGRQIAVPADATDAEIESILSESAAPPAAPGAPGAPGGTIASTPAPTGALGAAIAARDNPAFPFTPAPQPGLLQRVRQNPTADAAIQVPFGAAKGAAEVAMLPLTGPDLLATGADWLVQKVYEGGKSLARNALGIQPPTPEQQQADAQIRAEVAAQRDAINPFKVIPNAVRGLIEGVTPRPETGAGRIANRVSQEFGAMAVPAAYGLNKAKAGIDALRAAPTPLSRMFAEPAAVNPTKFLRNEAYMAGAAGAGAAGYNALAGEVDKNTGQYAPSWGDFLSSLGGVGTAATVKAIAQPVGTAVSAVTGRPQFIDGVVRDVATDELARGAGLAPNARGVIDTTELVDAITSGRRVSDTIPGFTESLADRTKNPGIAAMEYSRQSGDNAGVFTTTRNQNAKAVDAAMNQIAPEGTPGALRAELEARRDAQLNDLIFGRTAAEREATAAKDAIAPAMPDATARGSVARAALQDAYGTAKDKVAAAYEPINTAQVPVEVSPLAERFKGLSDTLPLNDRERFLPNEANIPAKLLDPETQAGQVPLREITALRSGLSDDIRAAQASGQNQRGRVAGLFKGEVDQFIDQSIPPQLREQYDQANAARRDFGDRFERPGTALQRVLQRREGGGYQLDDSAVTRQFTPTDQGRVTDFRDAMREAGTDTRLRDAIADEVVSEAQRRGVIDRPDALRKFLADRSLVLGEFPELRGKLAQVADSGEALAKATTREADFRAAYGAPGDERGTSAVGRHLQYGPENSDKAMKAVLLDKNPGAAADELLTFVKNEPAAVEGARKAFWNIMSEKSRRAGETTATIDGIQPWMPGKLREFIADPAHAAVAERLYKDNPDHLKRLREIADTLQGVDLRNSAKAPNTSGTPQGLQSSHLPSGETLASRIFAVERGVVSPAFAALNIVGIMARKATKNAQIKAVNMAIDKALTDPDWAAALLKENNPANRAALRRSATGWLGNDAGQITQLLADDEADPVKDALSRK